MKPLTSHKTFVALLALTFAVVASPAFAEEGTDVSIDARADVHSERPTLLELHDRIEARKAEIEAKRSDLMEQRDEHKAEMEEKRTDAQEQRDEKKTEFEQKRADAQEHREAKRIEFAQNAAERIQAHLDRFVRLLNAAIDRAEGLIVRMEARADELDAQGKDTSEARAHLDVAVTELASADSDLARIQADLDATLTIDTEFTRDQLQGAFQNTRTAIESAKTHIKAAHEAIRAALKSLKALVSVEATTDASVEVE